MKAVVSLKKKNWGVTEMPVAYLAGSAATLFNEASGNYSNPFAYDSGTTGVDRFLVVTVMHENGASGPSAITYGGLSLTQSAIVEVAPADNFSETGYIWTLVNPPTGTNNVVITGSADSLDGGGTAAIYTGVDQSGPIGNTATAARLSEDPTTVSITKQSEDNLIVWTYVYDQGSKGMAVIANNVGLVLAETSTDSNRASSFGTGYRSSGTGTVLVGAERTLDIAADNGIAAIELLAAAAGPNTPINPSITDLLATSARLNWEQG